MASAFRKFRGIKCSKGRKSVLSTAGTRGRRWSLTLEGVESGMRRGGKSFIQKVVHEQSLEGGVGLSTRDLEGTGTLPHRNVMGRNQNRVGPVALAVCRARE